MSSRLSVAALLRESLVEHGLRPGDRLPPERELAAELGVSRPALREATRHLLHLGVLRARQGSGTYLAEVDPQQLLEVRLRLEPLAAELAAERRDDEQLAELDALLTAMSATLDDAAAFAALDLRVHERIAEASGNAVLLGVLSNLAEVLRYSRERTSGSPTLRRTTVGDLAALVDAIRAGDAATAGAAMRHHLEAVARSGAPAR